MSNRAASFERTKKLEENILGGFKDSNEKRYANWKKEDPEAFEKIVLESLPKQCSLTEMKGYIAEMKAVYRKEMARRFDEEEEQITV